ncbi:MAG TPA: shikimate dehydrogenase [Chitinophagaceae bacterium]|nr:shikimate dehydrogenase [Chitinophagaceae bacterium]
MRLFGLIGYPLTHSFSKSYFSEKFKKEGIGDCSYENFQLADINDLPKIIIDNPDLQGLNVTIPHKESVLQFLNESNDLVKQTGACNCIKIERGYLKGYNTDVPGFERSLLKKLLPTHRDALILGTGGAAKAVGFVLQKNKIHFKYISRRSSETGLTYDHVTPALIREHRLIINTTPAGMFPNVNEFPPIPYDAISKDHFLFDLVYNPPKTIFLSKGEERGALVENGYDMLVHQAEESWAIWNQ